MAVEKKKIFQIEVPLLGQQFPALSTAQENLDGKFLKLDMTRMLRGRGVEAVVSTSLKDGKLSGNFVSLRVMPSYIRRMIRKNISWIEDSFSCPAKDAKLTVKPFMITKKRVYRSVRQKLRESAKEFITKFAAEKNASEVFEAVLRGSLQKEMASQLKKIYPLAFCEIRVLKLEK